MKIFSFIRRQMTPLFALRYLFSARPNSKEPAISRKIQFACLFLLLGLLSTAAQSGFAQSGSAQSNVNPLAFGNNFFVTGDYVVAGAQGLGVNAPAQNGFATGTITIPDLNPGITGTNQVPPGAQIVTALLYWQTVEKSTQLGTGQNGFFRPLFAGGPKTGYSISGATASQSTVSFSGGGCTGSSGGKVVRTYRAEVTGYLPQDANGNLIVNGTDPLTHIMYGQYEVLLANNPAATLPTLGATLVIIYRVLSPDVPLNSIVIYDGAFAPGNNLYNMTQKVQGFYDAAHDPQARVSRLTHIVGNGHNYKFQTVYLNNVALPNLYTSGQPFPGWYGSWDNTTWTFPDPKTFLSPNSNPVPGGAGSATTMVVPSSSAGGCVSWGAVIVSTTVQNPDGDGLLGVWKTKQGYCDAAVNEGVCAKTDPSWVALPGAATGRKDVFVQLDYMCSVLKPDGTCNTRQANVTSFSNTSNVITVMANNSFSAGEFVQLQIPSVSYLNDVLLTVSTAAAGQFTAAFTHADVSSTPVAGAAFDPTLSFDPRLTKDLDGTSAIDKATNAFATSPNPITLHIFPTHAIQEQSAPVAPSTSCTDIPASPGSPLQLCAFPNQPGVVGWKGGLIFLKNQLVDTAIGNVDHDCTTSPPAASCVLRFQHGKKDSWHYALFAHGLGLPNWTLQARTLTSVVPSASTVTFITSTPHGLGLGANPNETYCPSGSDRVTVAFAITNPNLNGTFCVTVVDQFTFTIPVANSTTVPYTFSTDPDLAVASSGQAGTVSGFSDVGGQDSLITLGSWKPQNQTWQAKTGTFMHELGHTLGLTHGGFYFTKLPPTPPNPPDYTPTLGANCKPNHQSVMSYSFQIDLLTKFTGLDVNGNAILVQVPDYSRQLLDNLDKSTASPSPVFNSLTTYPITAWHGTASELGGAVGSRMPVYCDGTPIPLGTDLYRVSRPVVPVPWQTGKLSWGAGQNINLSGDANDSSVLRGHNDWNGSSTIPGIDLRQIGATGSQSAAGVGGLSAGGGVGGLSAGGGTSGLSAGGGTRGLSGGGGVSPLSAGGGKSEMTQAIAESFTRPPRNLIVVKEETSPRFIDLSWTAPIFGQIGAYRVYRSADGGNSFTPIATVLGSQLTYQDGAITGPLCITTGYQYYVTAVLAGTFTPPLPGPPPDGQESVPSNTVSTIGTNTNPLTGCYTLTAFSSPTSGVHGSLVPITWTLTDDFYTTGNPVTNNAANTLIAIGPLPNSCATTGPTTILLKGVPQPPIGLSTLTPSGTGLFTFSWDTDGFCAGSYTFQLTLDSGQTQTTTPALQLQIDVNDQDTPRITPLALPPGTVGLAYGPDTLTEDGGTPSFTWSITGLPSGISQQPAGSPTILGTTCAAAASYAVNATVTDSKSNAGSQAFSLQINKANTTTSVVSNANPSVFQQMVIFTVTVAPQYTCTPIGTVKLYDGGTQIGSSSLTNGTATFALSNLSVGVHSITASYGGDNSFNSSSSGVWSQTVNKASTQIAFNSVTPSPAFVGQPITISYTFSVVAPGAGSPIPPSGNITVTARDSSNNMSSCMPAAVLGAGACTLSPAPIQAGPVTFTINYPGDGNFVLSGANGSYTVYQLVFTVQPSNTGVGLTMTPAVQVAAQDGSNNTLQSFTGSITLAIGSGPGTLSGTTTQNAVSGVATFNDLSINMMANGYMLLASLSGGVAPATSNAFNIDGLLFAGTDHNTVSGTPLPDQLGRFTINGTSMTGGGALSVNYYINGMAQAGKFLYAGDPNSNTLRTIDFNGGLVSSVAAGFPNACCNEDMHFDAANNVLWHANNSLEIEKLDPATGAVITAYPQSDVVGITFVGNTIWITKWAGQQVGTWDPTTNTFTMKFATPANAGGLAYDPVNGTLWVGLQGGLVVPYDPTTGLAKGSVFSPFGGLGADTVDGLEFVSQVP